MFYIASDKNNNNLSGNTVRRIYLPPWFPVMKVNTRETRTLLIFTLPDPFPDQATKYKGNAPRCIEKYFIPVGGFLIVLNLYFWFGTRQTSLTVRGFSYKPINN